MEERFTTQPVSEGVYYLRDARGGVMYLVIGDARALLIDTGFGVGDLPQHLARLTPLPVEVVNTHAHIDHIQGNGRFVEVYMHVDEIPLVRNPATNFIPIHHGHVFDLGLHRVEVIAVPGHSPGSICLLDQAARVLFTGDSPRIGPVWLHLPTSLSVETFKDSMLGLKARAGEFDVIAPAHGEPRLLGSLLDDLITCATQIMSGELEGKLHQTRFGECLLAEVGEGGIMYKPYRIFR